MLWKLPGEKNNFAYETERHLYRRMLEITSRCVIQSAGFFSRAALLRNVNLKCAFKLLLF